MLDSMKSITFKEILETKEFPEVPGVYYGYIDVSGFVSVKHYKANRYKEVFESDMPLFISAVKVKGTKDFDNRLRRILERALAHLDAKDEEAKNRN